MHLSFVIPPPELRIGGLDTAINTLKEALEQDPEVTVTCDLHKPDPRADAVHFHGLWMPSHLAAYRHCQQMRIPYVVSPHGMLEPWAFASKRWKKLPFLKFIDGPNMRRSKNVFVTCAMEARNVRKSTQCEQVIELPLGLSQEVPTDRESARDQFGLEPHDRILLYLSRIDRKKGLDRLLQALEGVPQENWQLWIVGDGDPEWTRSLQDWASAKRRQLPPIHWLGAQWGDAKWPYLAAADLFCLPTHSENFGLAVLEALWVGTPVLTTPDTPWASHADVPGIHITPNEVPTLRQSLMHRFQDATWSDAQRQTLSSWSHQQFHWNQLRQRYLQAYTKLIGPSA